MRAAPSPRWLSALAAFGIVGCAVQQPPPAVSEQPIVNGTREMGEEAVVLVRGAFGICTGTLISERVVLTAKHCIIREGAMEPFPVNLVSVGVGHSIETAESVRVQEIITTPGGYMGSAIVDGSDVAALVLRDPVEGVTPIEVLRTSPEDLLDTQVTAIGFGTTPDDEIGIKYRTTTTIIEISDLVIAAREAICQGDSGGPIIAEAAAGRPRRVVGVASYGQTAGPAATCPAVLDAWNRLDLHPDVIDRALLISGACVETGEETCNSLDDDCNGTVDDGCAAPGEACETDADCAFGPTPEWVLDPPGQRAVCAEIGGARQCAFTCDPMLAATSCVGLTGAFEAPIPLDGFYCANVSGCEGFCVPGTAGAGLDGDACDEDSDCASLRCADVDGARVCATPCLGGALACPSAEVCSADRDACGVCGPTSMRPSGRTLGEPCTDAAECAAGNCFYVAGRSICTAICERDRDCPEAMRCEDGLCARGERSDRYESCAVGTDCVSEVCAERDGVRFCAPSCASSDACEGTCTDVDGSERCFPDAPVLGERCEDTCAAGECIEGTCTASCGEGESCPVGLDCVRDGARTLCRAPAAPPSSGCSASGRPASASPLATTLALLGLAGAWRRRSRRAR